MATSKSKSLTLALAAGLLAATAPAFAETRVAEVRVNDLNLASESGQQTLEDRIERAIKNVCRSNGSRELSERRSERRCEAVARTSATSQAQDRIAAYEPKKPRIAAVKVAVNGK